MKAGHIICLFIGTPQCVPREHSDRRPTYVWKPGRLRPAGRKKLDELIPSLQALGSNDKIVVYGYTDDQPVGKALMAKGIADHLDLSSKRANEVVRYLTSKGVNPAVVSAKGRGDTHPVAPNDTRAGRAQNRRIDV